MQRLSETTRRGGFTMVELLVVMGISVIVMSILLQTFDQTREVAHRNVDRITLRQEVAQTLHHLASIVSEAVPMSSLDISPEAQEVFEPTRLRVVSWHGAGRDTLRQYEVQWVHVFDPNEDGTNRSGPKFMISNQPLGVEPPQIEVRASGMEMSLNLRYSAGADANGEIVWKDSCVPPDFPRLVELTVSAQSTPEVYQLCTVIATGWEAAQ